MSFEFEIDAREQAKADLISRVGADLQSVFMHRKEATGLNQSKLAEDLGVDRSRVNRCLSGYANLTLATIADLALSLDAKVIVKIVPNEEAVNWALCRSTSRAVSAPKAAITGRPETTSGTRQAASGAWSK